MGYFSYLMDRRLFLLIGVFLLVAAAAFLLTGKTLERYGRFMSRAEDPKRFWWDVVMWFLIGFFFIGLYLYQNSN